VKVLAAVLLSVGASTMLGVLGGIVVRSLPHRWNDIVLGFSAGVMLAAATVGLLAPAFDSPECSPALPVVGALAGATVISLLDRVVPHLHRLAGLDSEEHLTNGTISRTLLFVAALALHKLPEGLAVGVSFGTGEIGDVITVAGSISVQNIPEAFVIVAPLFAIGVGTSRVLCISLGIAAVSVMSVLCGYALVSVFACVLPFLLSAAGGAMLYVVSDEMIPETHAHGFEKAATFALLAGFLLVLVLQKLLADAV
jgi:ZIP family zinc transporter